MVHYVTKQIPVGFLVTWETCYENNWGRPGEGGGRSLIGVVNGPLKNKKSRQILPKSRNLAQPSNGSRGLRFCVCRSYKCFSIKSLNFSVSVSDFKVSESLGFTMNSPPLLIKEWLATAYQGF